MLTWRIPSGGGTASEQFFVGTVGLGILYATLLGLLWFDNAQPVAAGMAIGIGLSVLGLVGLLFITILAGGAMGGGADRLVYLGTAESIGRDPELRGFALLALFQVALVGWAIRSIRLFPRGARTLLLLVLGVGLALAGVASVLLMGAMTWSTS
jgi:hypothetical protein